MREKKLPKLLFFSFLSLFLLLALLRPSATGVLGHLIQGVFFFIFGQFALAVPLLLFLFLLSDYLREVISVPFLILTGVALLTSLSFLQSLAPKEHFLDSLQNGGGLLGFVVYSLSQGLIGKGGFYLLLFFSWFFLLLYFSPLFGLLAQSLSSLREKKRREQEKRAKGLRGPISPSALPVGDEKASSSSALRSVKKREEPKEVGNSKPPLPAESRGATSLAASAKPKASKSASEFSFPPLELLTEPRGERGNASVLKGREEIILSTLHDFGVEAKITDVRVGPRITRFELQPAAGVKVKEIVSLQDDLSLHLAASPIRIEAPIPGKSAVGIEVPNEKRRTVYLRELMEDLPLAREVPGHLYFALGQDISGEHIVADLTKMPHLLIAGATGSGKSVCLNAVISSLLFRCQPSEVRFLMIDPKRVELTLYDGIPHLLTPVMTDAKQATQALEVVIAEMEERYEVFSSLSVRNILSYNEVSSEKLPYWVIVIDELADLMFQSSLDTERNVCRIAQLSRATGIHLVIATQRPSVNVITGLIKANIPSRVAFAVASQTDSRVILDQNGAERLLGEGDMLFLPIEEQKPRRLQGVFVSEEESRKLAAFWKEAAAADYDLRFERVREEEPMAGGEEEKDTEDPLLPQVLEVILTTKQASASLLQRKLRIGYARAGRLMDLLEKKGIVGGQDGAKPREILYSDEELYQLLPKMKEEAE